MNSKHLLFSLTVALLSAGLFPSAAQAATITIDSLIYQTNGDGTASVTDCTDSSGSVEIPSSITVDGTPYTVTSIGNYAFFNCTSLTNIIIPNSVQTIGGYAFTDCTKLTNITIPDSVTSIGNRAFVDCSSLTNIIIPDSVQTVSEGSFAGCNSLTEIQVDSANSNYQSIEGVLFSKNLTLLYAYPAGKTNPSYSIPNAVKTIGDYAFSNCNRLETVNIGKECTSIGEGSFAGCNSLTQIFIPDSVLSIGNNAFFSCKSLKEIIIPNSVSSIGEYAFLYCKSLNKVYFQSQKPPKMDDSTFSKCPSNMMIYYPAGAEPNWGPLWHEFSTAPWDPVK